MSTTYVIQCHVVRNYIWCTKRLWEKKENGH